MCKRTAIEHGWGCKPPHRAREEDEEKKNYKGEERGELEERGGERGARAREDWQRKGTTGLVMGACSCASAKSKRSDAREVLRGHVRDKHQETDRSKRARALRMVLGARRRGGEVGCGDGAAKAKGSDEGAARVEGDDGSGGLRSRRQGDGNDDGTARVATVAYGCGGGMGEAAERVARQRGRGLKRQRGRRRRRRWRRRGDDGTDDHGRGGVGSAGCVRGGVRHVLMARRAS